MRRVCIILVYVVLHMVKSSCRNGTQGEARGPIALRAIQKVRMSTNTTECMRCTKQKKQAFRTGHFAKHTK